MNQISRQEAPLRRAIRQRSFPLASLAMGLLAFACLCGAPAQAQQLHAEVLVEGLQEPVFTTFRPQDRQSVFVVERAGLIRRIRNGNLTKQPYLDLTGQVSLNFEQGLLCMAFHPSFPDLPYCYVSYIDLNGDTVFARYMEDANDPGKLVTESKTVIMGPLEQPGTNHNGGCLAFGPDGLLYIGMGDGGSSDLHLHGLLAQDLTSYMGKILRIDVDAPAPHIPPSNPYVGDPNVLDEIWASGVRNPWRFSFDQVSGELVLGDVGANSIEELDVLPPSDGPYNLGWRCLEGNQCTGLTGCECEDTGLWQPTLTYDHNEGCAIIAGPSYRGCGLQSFDGQFFYADFCTGAVYTYDPATQVSTNRTTELGLDPSADPYLISSFGCDFTGEVLMTDYDGGRLYRVVPQNSIDCDGDGIQDACAILLGQDDVNLNGIPDKCECLDSEIHCTAKPTGFGCEPKMAFEGEASLTSSAPFLLFGNDIPNNRNGLFFYGYNGSTSLPFLGGTLCVQAPLRRTPPMNSLGSVPPEQDCTGFYMFNFNQWIQSVEPFGIQQGQEVNGQFWFRDVHGSFKSGLTDAVRFWICS